LTHDTASDFPELRRVFSGYLHEDVLEESGSPEAALTMFWTDAAPDERRRFQHEVTRFLAHTSSLDLVALRDLVYQLGARWTPPTATALAGLLTEAAHLPEPPPR